jgi:hypothetical protein
MKAHVRGQSAELQERTEPGTTGSSPNSAHWCCRSYCTRWQELEVCSSTPAGAAAVPTLDWALTHKADSLQRPPLTAAGARRQQQTQCARLSKAQHLESYSRTEQCSIECSPQAIIPRAICVVGRPVIGSKLHTSALTPSKVRHSWRC